MSEYTVRTTIVMNELSLYTVPARPKSTTIDGHASFSPSGWVHYSEDIPEVSIGTFAEPDAVVPKTTRTVWIPVSRIHHVVVEVTGEEPF